MELRKIFDAIPEKFDKYRPRYSEALFADLIAYANVGAGKQVQKLGEDFKVSVRGVSRDALEKLKAMKKNNEITEDDQSNGEKKIQTLTDKYCKEVEDVAAAKEKEIMEI